MIESAFNKPDPELLPCPFCGSEAFFVKPCGGVGNAEILCANSDCNITMLAPIRDHRLQAMADRWNHQKERPTINTLNVIYGLVIKRQAVKTLIAPHGDIANQEMAKELIREFCVENQWAFGPDVPIPAESTYYIDWDAVSTVARSIARAE